MMKTRILVAALLVGALVGCAGAGPKQTVGTAGGAALGGLIGAQFGHGSGALAATAAGVVIGGILGNQIGAEMDRQDQMLANQAAQRAYAAPVGAPVTWNNPSTGHAGTIVVQGEGVSPEGRYCREYTHTITIDGRQERAYGRACRQPDGSWQVVN